MKKIDLKATGKSYGGANVYQNVNTFGKIFQLGIKKEKLTKEFLKSYIQETNKNFSYTHYSIGAKIDFIINDLKFLLDNVFERIIRKFKNNLYGKTFPSYVDDIINVFPFIKENILGVYEQTIFLKSYWGYYTPNNIDGRMNNIDLSKIVGKNFSSFLNKIKNENQENRIFKNVDVQFIDEMVPIFPGNFGQKETSQGKIPVKYIDDSMEVKMNEIVDSIYDYFINNDMEEFVEEMKEYTEQKKSSKMNFLNGETDEKDIFIKFFLLYQKKLIDFVYDSYFRKSYIYGLDYYLYENQYFLDLSDVVFLGDYVQKTKGTYSLKNRISLEMFRNILIDGLKDGYFDHFVIKIFYKFENENGENFEIENVSENLYKVYDGKNVTYIEMDSEEENLLDYLGNDAIKKIRRGVTLGLYGNKLDSLKEFKERLTQHLKNAGYNIFLRKGGGENVFEHNNYLFLTNPLKSTTNMTLSLNIKRFFDIMPEITRNDEDGLYLGIDYYSKQPIIKQPFNQTDAKNIISVGASGSGKTMFMQQMISTNIRDKFFILDPTGTFAMLKNINKDIYVQDIFKLDYNPIALDKEYYDKFGIDYKSLLGEKVKLVTMLLGTEKLKVDEDFKTFLSLLISGMYHNFDKINIELIKNIIKEILDSKGKIPKWAQEDCGEKINSKDIYISLDKVYREILNLKTQGLIYDFLNKEQDLTTLFAKKTKIVINLAGLKIVDKERLDYTGYLIFLYFLQNILTYLTFNAGFIKSNLGKIDLMPNNYLIIDEIHLLFKEPPLRRLYTTILRTIRNKRGQITGLSQAVSDFAFSIEDGGGGSELDVLNNNYIKLFFQENDILSYISIMKKAIGEKNKNKKDGDMNNDEPNKLKTLNFYYNEFANIKKFHPKKRLVLVEYYNKYYLCETQLSSLFLNKMHLLKT